MKKKKREYLFLLEDILISMQRIKEYTNKYNFSQFQSDRKTVDAVLRNFEIIGEAARNILEEIKEKYSDLPWEEMYRLRNRVSHDYFGIDYEIIWDIVKNYLPNDLLAIKLIISKEKKYR